MEREGAAGDGWRVCACPCGGVARAAPVCRVCGGGGGGVAVVCDGFEGCFYAGVSREWGERAAGLGEPVGVEGSIFVGFDVEEVCAADGECAGGCGELDHLLGRVGGVCGWGCRFRRECSRLLGAGRMWSISMCGPPGR